jgi:hypothetical protein
MSVTDPSTVDDLELAILDALFRQRMQEVRQSPPELVDVAEMIAVISAAATRERDKVSKCRFPPRFDPGFPLRADPA